MDLSSFKVRVETTRKYTLCVLPGQLSDFIKRGVPQFREFMGNRADVGGFIGRAERSVALGVGNGFRVDIGGIGFEEKSCGGNRESGCLCPAVVGMSEGTGE